MGQWKNRLTQQECDEDIEISVLGKCNCGRGEIILVKDNTLGYRDKIIFNRCKYCTNEE